MRICTIVVAATIAFHAGTARAQSPNECLVDGKIETCLVLVHATFDAKQWPAALVYAEKAYELQKTPMNAVRVVIAASYAQTASAAATNLKTWLALKQHDAAAKGDMDASWGEIDPLGNALIAAAKREEDRIAALEAENAQLRNDLLVTTVKVKVQTDRIDDLEMKFNDAQTQLRALESAGSRTAPLDHGF
jgi:hypothetical protein